MVYFLPWLTKKTAVKTSFCGSLPSRWLLWRSFGTRSNSPSKPERGFSHCSLIDEAVLVPGAARLLLHLEFPASIHRVRVECPLNLHTSINLQWHSISQPGLKPVKGAKTFTVDIANMRQAESDALLSFASGITCGSPDSSKSL